MIPATLLLVLAVSCQRTDPEAQMEEARAALGEDIPAKASLLSGAAHRNFDRWDTLGIYVWPNVVVLGDYMAEVRYLQQFYRERLHWMDSEISFW